jgi:phage tail sheath protein FI
VLDQALGLNSASGALYFPWLDIGFRTTALREQPIYVPPCGHIAGIYARSDAQVGVHKAPANLVVEGALDLQINLTDSQQAQLNDRQVNCLRSFSGRGIRVWGARTLSQEPTWTYVNVRRLFLAAARWIHRSLADVAFEPNDPLLWARIERELNGYFNTLFQRGALRGATPEEAFYARCDATTNPLDARDQGQVVTEIGLAPSLPNEFVVVQIIHGASGVTMAGPRLPG